MKDILIMNLVWQNWNQLEHLFFNCWYDCDTQELESLLAAKEAALPQEPASNDERAVNLLVRMPDGSRRCRRFLKSDNLQVIFQYVCKDRNKKK